MHAVTLNQWTSQRATIKLQQFTKVQPDMLQVGSTLTLKRLGLVLAEKLENIERRSTELYR